MLIVVVGNKLKLKVKIIHRDMLPYPELGDCDTDYCIKAQSLVKT